MSSLNPEFVWGLYEFEAEQHDELPFKPGERIRVLEKDEEFGDGWWGGENEAGQRGIFPYTYTTTERPQHPPLRNISGASSNKTRHAPKASIESTDSQVMQDTMTHVDKAIAAQSMHNNDTNNNNNNSNSNNQKSSKTTNNNENNKNIVDNHQSTIAAAAAATTATNNLVNKDNEVENNAANVNDKKPTEDNSANYARERGNSFAPSMSDDQSMMSLGADEDDAFDEDANAVATDPFGTGTSGVSEMSDSAAKRRQILALKAAKQLELERKQVEEDRLRSHIMPPPIDGLEISDESDVDEDDVPLATATAPAQPKQQQEQQQQRSVSTSTQSALQDPNTQSYLDVQGDSSSTEAHGVADSQQQQIPKLVEPEGSPKQEDTAEFPTSLPPATTQSPVKPQEASYASVAANTPLPASPPAPAPAQVQTPTASTSTTNAITSPTNTVIDENNVKITPNNNNENNNNNIDEKSAKTLSTSSKASSNNQKELVNSNATAAAVGAASAIGASMLASSSDGKQEAPPSPSSEQKDQEQRSITSPVTPAQQQQQQQRISNSSSMANGDVQKSSSSIGAVSDKSMLKTDPTTWTIDQVIEWGKSKGFDATTLSKFREHEISGDVLIEMNVTTLKEIDLPAFGRRVHIYNAIKELKQNIHQQQQNQQASPLIGQPHTPTSTAFSSQEPDTPGSGPMQFSPDVANNRGSETTAGSNSALPSGSAGSAVSGFQYPSQYPSTQPAPTSAFFLQNTLNNNTNSSGNNNNNNSINTNTKQHQNRSMKSSVASSDSGKLAYAPEDLSSAPPSAASSSGAGAPWNRAQPPSPVQESPQELSTSTSSSRLGNFMGLKSPYKPTANKSSDNISRGSGGGSSGGTHSPQSPTQNLTTTTTTAKKSSTGFFRRVSQRPSTSSGSPDGDRSSLNNNGNKMLNGSKGATTPTGPSSKTSGGRKTFLGQFSTPLNRKSESVQDFSQKISHPTPQAVAAPVVTVPREGAIRESEDKLSGRVKSPITPTSPTNKLPPLSNSLHGKTILDKIGEPDKQGWLQKKTDQFGGWKLRYLVLKDNHLYYLKSNTADKVKGWIDLNIYKIYIDSPGKNRSGFVLMAENRPPHHFASEDQMLIDDWTKSLMKTSIRRNPDDPVVAPSNVNTISLTEARSMFPPPRPPSPTSRARVQAEYIKQRGTMTEEDVMTMIQTSPLRTSVHVGSPTTLSSPHWRNSIASSAPSMDRNRPSKSSTSSGHANLNNKPLSPKKSVKRKQVQQVDDHTNNSFSNETSEGQQHNKEPGSEDMRILEPLMNSDKQELLAWVNATLPTNMRAVDFCDSFKSGEYLYRLVEVLSGGRSRHEGVDNSDSTRFAQANTDNERVGVMMDVFDYMVDEGVDVGDVSMGDILRGSEEQIYKLVQSIRNRYES